MVRGFFFFFFFGFTGGFLGIVSVGGISIIGISVSIIISGGGSNRGTSGGV